MMAPEEAAARRLLRLILNPWALVSDRIASSEIITQNKLTLSRIRRKHTFRIWHNRIG